MAHTCAEERPARGVQSTHRLPGNGASALAVVRQLGEVTLESALQAVHCSRSQHPSPILKVLCKRAFSQAICQSGQLRAPLKLLFLLCVINSPQEILGRGEVKGVISASSKIINRWNFLGGPVVKTLSSQCRGSRFDPWSGN